jgi:AH receptor-interacting protein
VKAHYRRAKAHVGAWNPDEAKQDFLRAAQLDPSLSVTKELKDIEQKIKEKEKQDRAMLQGKLFT